MRITIWERMHRLYILSHPSQQRRRMDLILRLNKCTRCLLKSNVKAMLSSCRMDRLNLSHRSHTWREKCLKAAVCLNLKSSWLCHVEIWADIHAYCVIFNGLSWDVRLSDHERSSVSFSYIEYTNAWTAEQTIQSRKADLVTVWLWCTNRKDGCCDVVETIRVELIVDG